MKKILIIIVGTVFAYQSVKFFKDEKDTTKVINISNGQVVEVAINSKKRKAHINKSRKKLSSLKKQLKTLSHELKDVIEKRGLIIGNTWQEQEQFSNSATPKEIEKLKKLNKREVILTAKRMNLLEKIKTELTTRRM